jgi:anti-sigma factor RsiW
MKCREVLKLVSAFADSELDAKAAAGVSAHLAACASCRAEIEAMRLDRSVLQSVETAEPSPYLVTRLMAEVRQAGHARPRLVLGRALTTLAAALVVAVSIGAGTMLGSGLARTAGTNQTADDTFGLNLVEVSETELYQSAMGGE